GWFRSSHTTFIRRCTSIVSAAKTPGLCGNSGVTGAPGFKCLPPKPTGPCQPGPAWFRSSQTTFVCPCTSIASAANTSGLCSKTGVTGAPGFRWRPPKPIGPCQPGFGRFRSSQITFIRPCTSIVSAANTPGLCAKTGVTGAPGFRWRPPKPTGPCQPGFGTFRSSQITFIRPCTSIVSAANTPGLSVNTRVTGAPGCKWSAPEPPRPLPALFRLVHVAPADFLPPAPVIGERCEHARALRENRGHGSARLQVVAPEAHRALPARIRQVHVEPYDIHAPVPVDGRSREEARVLPEQRRHGSAGLEGMAPEAHRAVA